MALLEWAVENAKMGREVVAINAAILPEFGGSNLGVPVALVRELLERESADVE